MNDIFKSGIFGNTDFIDSFFSHPVFENIINKNCKKNTFDEVMNSIDLETTDKGIVNEDDKEFVYVVEYDCKNEVLEYYIANGFLNVYISNRGENRTIRKSSYGISLPSSCDDQSFEILQCNNGNTVKFVFNKNNK